MRKSRYIWMMMMLLLAAMPSAGASRYGSAGVSHWLGVSLAGMEASPVFGKGTEAFSKAGGGGQATLLYELHKGHFFFNAGVGVDYLVTNCGLDAYQDAFPRTDFTGEAVTYRYLYSDYREQQQLMRVVVPVQFGYRFGRWVYVGLGAAYHSGPLKNAASSTARMFTEGEYGRFIQPIRNAEAYEYWPEAEYSGTGTVKSASHELALEAEVGARIPIISGVQMRVGAFVGYDFPIASYGSKRAETPLVVYSETDTRDIRFNSLLDSPVLSREAQRLRVGLKLTFIFNVTHNKTSCMCMTE